MKKFLMAASDISFDAPQSNEIYFSVTMRMLTTETNLNGVRLTEGFINDIAEHAEEYTCMPLCADTEKLARGQDTGLTHMYDEREAVFKAPQIGSFYEVHKVADEHGTSLVGTARINKRNADVTEKIIEMYNSGRLKFSFEIWASDITEEDGVIVVDAAEGNRLTAMAIVTTPALPAAVALNLAADFDVNGYEDKIWQLLYREYPDSHWRMVWMGIDYSVIQFVGSGTMLHIGYKFDGMDQVKTDEYEVVFARIDEVNEKLENENGITAEATNIETPTVEETTAIVENAVNPAEAPAEEAAPEAAPETAEEETAEVEESECKEERAETSELDELRAELARVQAELDAVKEAERQAELAEKREKARKYAERQHLNLESESVKAAIENADYEALAAEVMAKPEETHENESYRVVAEMNMNPFGNMFDKAN